MKVNWSSNYYDDVTIHRCQPEDILTEEIVLRILDECNDHPRLWFEDLSSKNLWYLLIATVDGKPISICGCREDGKVLKGPNYFKPNIKQILES